MNRSAVRTNQDVSVQYGTVDLAIPPGFRNILQLIGHQVLKFQQPGEITHFIADYLQKLLAMRETTGYDPVIHGDMLERIQAYYYQLYSSELKEASRSATHATTYDEEEVSDEDDFVAEFEEDDAGELENLMAPPEEAVASPDSKVTEDDTAVDNMAVTEDAAAVDNMAVTSAVGAVDNAEEAEQTAVGEDTPSAVEEPVKEKEVAKETQDVTSDGEREEKSGNMDASSEETK
ncbi:uncharacterized protein [Antedon mediterranea]|uniref:uncharacterized protein isoform X1 n=1 Tax=Antedon mediterranea TaxID=105859 RepID=UPI003AF524B4